MLEGWVISFGGLLLSGLVVWITVARIARRKQQRLEQTAQNFDFSMDELQRMLDTKQITREEYERLKDKILNRRTPPPDQRHVGFEVLPPRDHI